MYDINFFMKSYPIRKRLESGEKISQGKVLELFEDFRSKDPVIYNIETTNACNMTCKMCPRTTKKDKIVVSILNIKLNVAVI